MMKCEQCGEDTPLRHDAGVKRKYCSRKCYHDARAKQYAENTDHGRLRWCSSCKQRLPADQFYAKPSICKACTRKRCDQGVIERKQQLVDLLGGGCAHCGYKEHLAPLQFHHTDLGLKTATWGTMRGRSFAIIREWARAEKIECLCANCHFIEHANY